MYRNRIIPCLLLKGDGLVKTVQFSNPKYVGDPINAVKIFNDKEVDELLFIDIETSKTKKEINFKLLSKISSQSFMPLGYGGGIKTVEELKKIFSLGFEKASINSYLFQDPGFIKKATEIFGSQSIVASIDVKKNMFGKYKVYNHTIGKTTDMDPVDFAQQMEKIGAGEIILNSVDTDGMMKGYNLDLIKKVSSSIDIPLIALGGAGHLCDLSSAIAAGASAAAAGSIFVFYDRNKAVLINYPDMNGLSLNQE